MSPRNATGLVRQQELDALLLGVLGLLGPGRHLGLGAAVDQVAGLRPQAAGGADGVHGRVAAAHHGDVLAPAVEDRLVVTRGIVGAHQVDAGQELVGRVDAVEVLAGDAQELGQARAGGHEHGVDSLPRSSARRS